MPDLVEDREAVVEEVVEHLVEEPPGALREELLAEALVLFAAPEEPRHRHAARPSAASPGSRGRRRSRARRRSAAGRRGRRPGSGGRRRGSPRRRSRRPSAAGASTARPRRRAGASRTGSASILRASSESALSRWIQVRPAALSSAGGDGGAVTATTVSRVRVRRMRGRLGIGTEWILDDRDQRHIRDSSGVSRPIDRSRAERGSAGAPGWPQMRRRRSFSNDGYREVVGANLSYLEPRC